MSALPVLTGDGGPTRKKGELGGTDKKMSHRSTENQPGQSLRDQAGPENDHQVDFQLNLTVANKQNSQVRICSRVRVEKQGNAVAITAF